MRNLQNNSIRSVSHADHTAKPAIVFDFGGVLIDWNVYYIYRRYFSSDQQIDDFLQTINFHDWNEELQRGIVPYSERIIEVSSRFPEYRELIEAFDLYWFDAVGRIIVETQDILKELRSKGYATYGLSNWPVEKFLPIIDRLEFLKYMDDYVISGEVHLIKPEPAFFFAFLERIRRDPEECIFIDDREDNVRVAKNLGFLTVKYSSPVLLRLKLNEYGVDI